MPHHAVPRTDRLPLPHGPQVEYVAHAVGPGQPRDGDWRAAWLLLDTTALAARWMRAEYDLAGAQAAIRAARLPESLAERLQYVQ